MENTNINIEILKELENIHMQDNEQSVCLLNQFLDNLSTNNRKVFIKRYYCYNDIKDIAAAMSINENTVRNILFRTCGELEAYIYSTNKNGEISTDSQQITTDFLYTFKKINKEFIEEATNSKISGINKKKTTSIINEPTKKTSMKEKPSSIVHFFRKNKTYLAITGCIVVILIVVLVWFLGDTTGISPFEYEEPLETFDIPYEDIKNEVIDTSDYLSNLLPTVTYNDTTYVALHTYVDNNLFASKVLEEEKLLNTVHKITKCELYSCHSNKMIGVQFPQDEKHCYLYISQDYSPETLRELYDDLDFHGCLVPSTILYHHNKDSKNYSQVISFEKNKAHPYLSAVVFRDLMIESKPVSSEDLNDDYVIAARYENYGFDNNAGIYMFIKEDGTLLIDYFGQKFKFKIEEDSVNEILRKLKTFTDMVEVDSFLSPLQ